MSSRSVTNRNPAIEVYRIALMIGITLLHVIGNARLGYDWVANMLHPCVTAFAFVSGWFGCKCRMGKFLRLYGVAIFCAAVMTTVLMHSQYVAAQFGAAWLPQFFRMFKNYWFLHAYAVMMLFAPVIDAAVDIEYSRENNKIVLYRLLPIVVLAFGWSFAVTFKFSEAWLPRASGFGAYTALTLIGAYTAARYCRWSGHLNRMPQGVAVAIFLACCSLAAVKLGRYNSPVALLMAAITFKWAKAIKIKCMAKTGAVICWLSVSMFSVYLLQVNDFMFPFIGDVSSRLASLMPSFAVVIVMTVSVFAVCLAIDLIRRIFLGVVLFAWRSAHIGRGIRGCLNGGVDL